MQHRENHTDLAGLLAQSLLATLGVVVLPIGLVLTFVALGLPDPQILIATGLGLAISCGVAAIGTSLWIKRPESIEVGFGELMLWRYLRRKKAEETIVAGSQRLGLVPDAAAPEVEPERRLAVLQDLAKALEAKDPYTHGHSRRVERHVYRTALVMHLDADDIEDLRLAAALHDVGKIQVPSAILRKPDKLTEDEFALVRRHPEVGAVMVDPNGAPSITLAVRHHHEAWNGAGYPAGLSGERIPLFARIIAVADAFDAMTSARPYKVARGRKEAIDVLRASSGVQFDSEVVEAFISTLPSALPAAGALLIFATPARAARRALGWVQSATGGGLAGAAGAVGVAVLVGTVGMTNVPGQNRAIPPQPLAPQAVGGVLPAAEPIVVDEDPSADSDEITTSDALPSRGRSSAATTQVQGGSAGLDV
ncbi:MAG: HD-GYP domain-containing protein, partial [Actinobacteria bacterium]|nr:HD-GYP domain-containing protein [Actinomycetota bacterium]